MVNILSIPQKATIRTGFKNITNDVWEIIGENQIDNYIDKHGEYCNKDIIKSYFHHAERTFTEKEVGLILNNNILLSLLASDFLKKYDSGDIEMIGKLFPPKSDKYLAHDIFQVLEDIRNYKEILKSMKEILWQQIEKNSENDIVLKRIHQGILAIIAGYTKPL